MKPSNLEPWNRLVALARTAPGDNRTIGAVPFGFTTRVVARAFAVSERTVAGLFEPFAFRALSIASLVAIIAVALNVSPVLQSIRDDITVAGSEPLSELVE